MKSLSIRGFAAMSLVAAFIFFGCSDDSSSAVTVDELEALSSSDDSEIESSSSAKLDEKSSSSSSKKVSSSSAEAESSSSSKKEKRSSSSSEKDDETVSSSSFENSSSSRFVDPDAPIVVPIRPDLNIILSNELVGDGLLTNSRVAGDEVRFKGRFSLDISQDTSGNSDDIAFTGIEYRVLNETNTIVYVNVESNQIEFPVRDYIDLNSMNSVGVKIDLLDPGFTACGNYKLMVSVTATNGVRDFQSTVLIPFERYAGEYCSEEKSSSSAAQTKEIPMTYCEVELSTNGVSRLNLASCSAVSASDESADIFFSKAKMNGNPEVTAISYNGVKIAPITNGDYPPYDDDYEVDIWPENTNADRNPACAYVSDFKFVEPDPGTTILSMVENSNQIYVALAPGYSTETGAGFYAFGLRNITELNNGEFAFVVKIYKVN
jgi:hypothetical protein